MPDHQVRIFAADNLFNPQNPGTLPIEDATFRSDLEIGDQITWLGGGTSEIITITDPTNDTFDEAQTDQTLAQAVTFNGTSYAAGQIVTPTYTIIFSDGAGNSYTLSSLNFDANNNGQEPDSVFWEGAIPPPRDGADRHVGDQSDARRLAALCGFCRLFHQRRPHPDTRR